MEIINEILNIPAVQIVLSVLTILYSVLRIISCTSIGKKALNRLTEQHNVAKSQVETIENDYKEFKAEKEEEIAKITENYEIKLVSVEDKYAEFKNQVILALSSINNEKVKEIVEQIKNSPEIALNLNDKIEQVKQSYEQELVALKERIEKLEYENTNPDKEEIQ